MAHVMVLRGTVVDAQTGRPIDTFTLVPGVQAAWMPDFGKIIHGGRYERAFDDLGIDRRSPRSTRTAPASRSSTSGSRRETGSAA
jgi:hypothetical protein